MTRLEDLREEKNFNKKQFAEKLNVSTSIYTRWENGKDIIPTRRMYQIANYYKVNIDYLLGFSSKRISLCTDDEIDINLVAERVSEIRNDFGETLREFSSRLNTSNSTWCAYEQGKVLILGAFVLELCKIGNYSIDWILGRSDKKYID